MADLTKRFSQNPLLGPGDVVPSLPGMVVECLLNPGVFRYKGRVGLLIRVAERPVQEKGWISTPVINPKVPGGIEIVRFSVDDPKLSAADPRVFEYDGISYLTTLSHLRLAWSEDGVHFTVDSKPTLIGQKPLELFGLEDSRVTQIGDRYYLTYTVVSLAGVAVGMTSTTDWVHFQNHGVIFPPHNKDCALFSEKINGNYWALHRPTGSGLGGNFIWTAQSPDLIHWGQHSCIAMTRKGMWDSERVGAGASPIRTPKGWLEIYHASTQPTRYCLGALLLAGDDPTRVLARSKDPIMEPTAEYEEKGFFGKVVFTNGHLVDGDTVTVYYGASDTVICAAKLSIADVLASLAT